MTLNGKDCQEAGSEEKLCCPGCGSFYLRSSKSSSGMVFHVHGSQLRTVVALRESVQEGGVIDRQAIFCCACSWHGGIEDLVVSVMG